MKVTNYTPYKGKHESNNILVTNYEDKNESNNDMHFTRDKMKLTIVYILQGLKKTVTILYNLHW